MTAFSTNIPGYEIIRELGVGGMANVYLAIQRSLDRKVAIKVMKRNIDDLEKFERRFLVEGRTMAKLPHRNIVAVYDIVKNDEVTYIAMEFLEGGTLSTKMKEGLSLGDAISVVVQIGQSLQFAHEHGVVHRDLKPANIMFRDALTPVLTDFGIAKQQDATATRLTQTGMLVGTPTYMSPEQINALEVDGRSDLYSLGILFYELLTGAPPFHADTPIAVLMAHLTTPPPPLPAGFSDFQPVIDRMLAKNRDDRFPSLKDFTRALKGAVVHNENLWARLQGDPNQSSSEQLRALGFSIGGGDSMPGAGQSGQIRLPPSGRGVPRTPTPGPISVQVPGAQGPQSGMYPAPRKPLWIWAVAAALLIGIGVAGFMLWPQPGVDSATRRAVDFTLIEVDRQIAAKDLAKANETLSVALGIAPEYEAVKARAKALVKAFKDDANAAIARRDLDTAFARVEQAKLIDAADPELTALGERIAQARNSAAQAQEIGDYLTRAEAATRQGRDFTAGGAYAILSEARAKAPTDPEVKNRLDALVARALKPARDALARQDLTAALNAVRQVENALANEPAWQKLRADVDTANDAQAARVRLASVLQTIDQQIRAGKLVQPDGDNAQETLARALSLEANNPEVLRRQEALAAALTNAAQAALNAGQVEAALQGANEALNVKDNYTRAVELKRLAESRLDANKAREIEGLAAVSKAIAQQRFLSPPGNNARELIAGVLRINPRSEEAQNQLTQLPQRIAEAAKTRAAVGDVNGAVALVEEARKAYPANMELAVVASDLGKKVAEANAQADRGKRFDRISQLLAARPLKPENIGNAATEIATLLAANAQDVDAVTARTRMFETLEANLRSAASTAELDNVAAALKLAQQQFATDAAATRLSAEIAQTRERVVAEEQQRLAAISGELVINALPWATVESVVDANKKPVALPADATTPLRLKLPAGVYTVTFKHPQVGRRATQVAQVQAQKVETSAASFSSAITAKDYLQRAGW